MLQLCRESYLAFETFTAERGGEIGMEQLDRNLAIVFDVVRQKHSRHPASADFLFDRVTPCQRHGESADRSGGGRCVRNRRNRRLLKREIQAAFVAKNGVGGDRRAALGALSWLRNYLPRISPTPAAGASNYGQEQHRGKPPVQRKFVTN